MAGPQAARSLLSDQTMDHLVTQFSDQTLEMDSLETPVDVGLRDLFEKEKITKKRRKKKRRKKLVNKTILTSEEEEFDADSNLSKISGDIFTQFMKTNPVLE